MITAKEAQKIIQDKMLEEKSALIGRLNDIIRGRCELGYTFGSIDFCDEVFGGKDKNTIENELLNIWLYLSSLGYKCEMKGNQQRLDIEW